MTISTERPAKPWELVHEYVENYEWRGDGDYTPNQGECALIEDAIQGFIGVLEDRGLLASRSGVGGREAVGAPELANEMFEVLFNETRDCVPESITDELLTKVAEAIIAGYSIERRAG